ncbi:MAG: hypothetical protein ACR2HO_09880 [Rubrobacteraceae bacterium]
MSVAVRGSREQGAKECVPYARVAHVQYSASNALGNAVAAQTVVMDYAIEKSGELRTRYFDFGISNERGGEVLNEGLYGFKAGFGAGGVVHEFYELGLGLGSG